MNGAIVCLRTMADEGEIKDPNFEDRVTLFESLLIRRQRNDHCTAPHYLAYIIYCVCLAAFDLVLYWICCTSLTRFRRVVIFARILMMKSMAEVV